MATITIVVVYFLLNCLVHMVTALTAFF